MFIKHMRQGLARGLLYGLLYAWADTLVVLTLFRKSTGMNFDPFNWTTVRVMGWMIGLCTLLGLVTGAIGGRYLEKRPASHPHVIAAGLVLITYLVSPVVDLITLMALLGIGFAQGVSHVVLRDPARRVRLLALAAPLMLVVWRLALAHSVPPALAHAEDPDRSRLPAATPNVLWVVFDTTRFDHVSTFGYPRQTTPVLDSLAREGVAFDHAYSAAPWTVPSHASMFTGLFSSQHHCNHDHLYLDEGYATLAGLLSRAGYNTGMFAGNPWLGDHSGLTRGYGFLHPSWQNYGIASLFMVERLKGMLLPDARDKGAAESNDTFKHWFAAHQPDHRPFFAFVNYLEPHAPYHLIPRDDLERFLPPGVDAREATGISLKFLGRQMAANHFLPDAHELAVGQAVYDGGIYDADRRLGELIDTLKAAGQLDNTLIIVNADHGEMFGEHGIVGHDLALYDALVHVPLVVRLPGRFPAGVHAQAPVQLTDLLPTVLEAAGLQARMPAGARGTSLFSVVRGGGDMARPLFAELFTPGLPILVRAVKELGFDPTNYRLRSVQVRNLRLLQGPGQIEKLFDVAADPGENKDVLADHPAEAQTLRRLFTAQVASRP